MSDSETEWFTDDAFWREAYSFMFPETRIAAASSEVEQIITLTACDKGRVFDLACGPGRYSVALARRGFRVTGVDRRIAGMVRVASDEEPTVTSE